MSGAYFGFVIATLNAAENLQSCLDSIFGQTDTDWQIVVIDGGSHDGTVDILRKNTGRLAYWVSEPDKGIYDAWNKAIPHLSCSWVAFLGADDYLDDPRILLDVRPVLEKAEGKYSIVYGRVRAVESDSGRTKILGRNWPDISSHFRIEMCIPHQGVFHSNELFVTRDFDTSYFVAGDYELLLGELLQRPPLFYDRVISTWRLGGVSSRPETSYRVFQEFRRAQRQHGVFRLVPSAAEIRSELKRILFFLFGRYIGAKAVWCYREMVRFWRLP